VVTQVLTRRSLGITGNPDYEGEPFTDFGSVTPKTDLSALNLNWRERDLPEKLRTKHVHRLHPYLGKFVPQLVEIFLRKYQPRTVLDPFCGSGTTLVEANALGINSLGSDISEFDCLLSRVKTERYDLLTLEREIADIVKRVQRAFQPGLFVPDSFYTDEAYLARWFHPRALAQLLYYRSLIGEYEHQDVLRVVLSRSARSARLTTHFDLDFPKRPQTGPYYCYKHRRTCQPTDSALKFLLRYSLDTLARITEFANLQTRASIEVVCGDSRYIDFPQADAVITSPPYVGLIDYHEQHRYAFELLGLQSNEDEEIGRASNGSSRKAVDAYVEGMTAVFANVLRSLSPGGVLVVVVHDRRDLYDEIGSRLGVSTEFRFDRHVNRRTGRRAGDFFENVIVWRR
jgi:SAM-dependent methyltransferase